MKNGCMNGERFSPFVYKRGGIIFGSPSTRMKPENEGYREQVCEYIDSVFSDVR
jgi:hypothetical protein